MYLPEVSTCFHMLTNKIRRLLHVYWSFVDSSFFFFSFYLKGILKSFAQFSIGLSVIFFLIYMISLQFSECKSCSSYMLFNIFQHSVAYLFLLLMVYLDEQSSKLY